MSAALRAKLWPKFSAAGIGATALATASVFAGAAALGLWVAGPDVEARATIEAPVAVSSASGASFDDSEAFAGAVAERLGEAGAFLRTPGAMERIASIVSGTPTGNADRLAAEHVRRSVSIRSDAEGGFVVSVRGNDVAAATALADAASAELVDRLGESMAAGEGAAVVRRDLRSKPQPFVPVMLIAGLLGWLVGAVAGRFGRQQSPPDRDGSEGDPDAADADRTSRAGAPPMDGPSAETVTAADVAAALTIEHVSLVFVASRSNGRASRHLALRLAGSGASVLVLDFSSCHEGPSADGAETDHGSPPLLVETVPVASPPSRLSNEDRAILSRAGEAYDHVVVDCGDLPAGEIALLADEDSAVLVGGRAYAGGRAEEFEEAGLATLVLRD